MCMLSAYLNTFFCAFYGVDNMNATTQIAPVIEEVMKLLPLLFFMVIFEPKIEKFRLAAIITAVSFATFENICYLTGNGAEQIGFLLIRGFGAGAMHVVCGGAYSEGLLLVWENRMLRRSAFRAFCSLQSSIMPFTIFLSASAGRCRLSRISYR